MESYSIWENSTVWEYFIQTDLPRLTYWLTLLLPAGIGVYVICLAQLNNFELPKRRLVLFRMLFISEIAYLFTHFLREVVMEFRWGWTLNCRWRRAFRMICCRTFSRRSPTEMNSISTPL